MAAAFAVAEGAIEIGFIQSRKYPAFKEGGLIKGKSHSEGGVVIEAEGGEFVTKVSQTKKYRPLLDAINKDNVEAYLTRDYLKPLLAKQKQEHDREQRMREAALHLATGANDLSHLERLTKRNGTVNLGNYNDMAKAIAREMKSGNNPRMK